ncbi:acyltransferase domain-containing protein [Gordonia amarae]|uniref:[acyl-carrier-protein] S-malonyltransferase n=2 Tax=Gordonia amarae TaxID=36821 RepID=G7GPZ0_9ACTN|nr:ACP S-malonyltransferase [Gordonia amarae]MCS3879683.1 [acyl-carrier-protein] S-malonyltransferase [Gordonia amarae]QHN18125.1 acyltransferase domain-containing protein [Gordonia amarae]QHN22646.1 acyltransferase domain-containing protein [Gordonia amarae]QHN31512.1 acyltransferase domain-containing protein [Gordonia amarae]QHN40256.1 acyltransferase domain-containing protein [Gordonia amarae]
MLSILAPGQGSQTPGMLATWLELPGARDQLATWSKLASLDLEGLGTTATADEITDTAVTQPLIVAASLLAYDELSKRGTLPAETVVAGHSVGELTAAAIAGVISADEAITLAAVRGEAMAQACATEPTTMAAVLGGDEQAVLDRLAELGLIPANRNAKGQIVAAGAAEAIDELVATPPEKARIRKLAVAGAFHTDYMASARDAVAEAAAAITPGEPTITLLSNSDGLPVTNGADALNKLVGQVTRPVRWDLCSDRLRELGTTALLELPPAGTLVGIARRELKGIPGRALKTPEDLDSITELG